MRASRTVRRPWSVTVVVVLTVLVALSDLVVAVTLIVAAASGKVTGTYLNVSEPSARDATNAAYVLGVLTLLLGLVQVALALLLARGSNGARLALTLVLLVRTANAVFVGTQAPTDPVLVSSVAVALTVFALMWLPAASAFFDRDGHLPPGARLGDAGQPRGLRSRILDYLVGVGALAVTVTFTPGLSVQTWPAILVAALLVSLTGGLLGPVFLRVVRVFGWLGAVALAIFANAVVIGLALLFTPGIVIADPAAAIVASWVYALVMTVLTWLLNIDSRDYLTVHAMRMSPPGQIEDPEVPGVVFVQLDGVPAPLLENEIRAGNLPTIGRWVRSGRYTWTEWTARVPSTTPVSQAGILHGHSAGIPAFRWYDRELGRLLVANLPKDAATIEARMSDGQGLLADDGVSISNLFSGDAPRSMMTMSGLRGGGGIGPSNSYAAFFTHPAGMFRALLLTMGEMVKELYQGRRQVRRRVEPRIHRGGAYIALRAATNVLIRDLNVALVVEAMMAGHRSVYVDFVDYDEIAHHAGVTRGESLDALYGLDEVLRNLEEVCESGATPRQYHLVCVSDHGQSQGATFLQRYGQSLEGLVLELMGGGTATAATDEVEAWGPVNVLLSQLSEQDSVTGRLTRAAIKDRPIGPAGSAAVGSAATGSPAEGSAPLAQPSVDADAAPDATGTEITVVGSGNLGGIWFNRSRVRLTAEEIERAYPGLLAGLAAHPGIGFVVVLTSAGPIALGGNGTHDLTSGVVTGDDPLALFGPDAASDFAHVETFATAPDIYVNSLYDPLLDEVAAFEELVGCHGGLGGWQTRPLLLHPMDWQVDAELLDDTGRLRGADVVHRQLVLWLERLGHRTHLAPRPPVGQRAQP